MKKCNQCGCENEIDALFCEKCGKELYTKVQKSRKWIWVIVVVVVALISAFTSYYISLEVNNEEEKQAEQVLNIDVQEEKVIEEETDENGLYELDIFLENIKLKYSPIVSEQFPSCNGIELMTYPMSASGYLRGITLDLDGNGRSEGIVLRSDALNQLIILEVYGEINNEIGLLYSYNITTMDYCAQQNVSIYYSSARESYLLVVDGYSSGAYTGNNRTFAYVYSIGAKQISEIGKWQSDNMGIENDDIESELLNLGVPYAQNCATINNITDESQYVELLEIKHTVTNSDHLGSYIDSEHYLQLISPEIEVVTYEEIYEEEYYAVDSYEDVEDENEWYVSEEEFSHEEKIEYIRDIYYSMQDKLETYKKDSLDGLYCRYLDSNNKIRKIMLYPSALEFPDLQNAEAYVAEYYYDVIDGVENLIFAFIWNKNTGEEYRFYRYDGELIRYIDQNGTIYDSQNGSIEQGENSPVYMLYTQGQQEIALAY